MWPENKVKNLLFYSGNCQFLPVPSYKNNNSDKIQPEPSLKISFDLAGSKI